MKIEEHQIFIACGCGKKEGIKLKNFDINIVGILQFKCKKCGLITSTPGAWSDSVKTTCGDINLLNK